MTTRPPLHEHDTQADRALRVADDMAIQASQYRQMGFKHLARWLDEQVKAARKWACRPENNRS